MPARFSLADEQLLETIARQFAVAATNGQLYERVHRAKIEWERTFDAISDPIAVFDAHGRTMRVNAALATLRAWKITETQGRTCAEVGLCGGGCPGCVVGVAAREAGGSIGRSPPPTGGLHGDDAPCPRGRPASCSLPRKSPKSGCTPGR
jgi:PAS domain-containing protein